MKQFEGELHDDFMLVFCVLLCCHGLPQNLCRSLLRRLEVEIYWMATRCFRQCQVLVFRCSLALWDLTRERDEDWWVPVAGVVLVVGVRKQGPECSSQHSGSRLFRRGIQEHRLQPFS